MMRAYDIFVISDTVMADLQGAIAPPILPRRLSYSWNLLGAQLYSSVAGSSDDVLLVSEMHPKLLQSFVS